MIAAIHDPEVGVTRLPGSPIKLSRTPGRVDRPAPRLGEHTADVFKEWLGLEAQTIDALKQEQIIA